jgi:hypothetical protein
VIPETGNREEFKAAVEGSFHPAVGEVYLRLRGTGNEYWKVSSFSWWGHVVYDGYWCLDDTRCFKKHDHHKRLSTQVWRELIVRGSLRFEGWSIPIEIIPKQDISEMVYETQFFGR